ncbi:transglutaminase domain-containing protein [Nocardioides sp. GXZ039]|uniref:transglutaminase domain-containing protein n=1 Tax=Nocardioides sp. GXZ039 TaxID=3136018 RepID=UPI0030F4442C
MVVISRELAQLRLQAERAARARADADLLALADRLRAGDPEWWPHLWAPAAAIAARRLGDDRAWPLLDEAIALGFRQPMLVEPDLEQAFGADEHWASALARIETDVVADVELLDWPDPSPQHHVELDRIGTERLASLRERVPQQEIDTASAWRTARNLLRWVNQAWEHANDHVEEPDALDVLDRVAAGERFACVEYSIVLSQALNAVGIPSRSVQCFQVTHHVGVGRGHVVSEAWIDDLDRWVLLDGQNGAYWCDEVGSPLGLPDLLERFRAGGPARMECLGKPLDDDAQSIWWSYFATALTGGVVISEGPFAALFQGTRVVDAGRLERSCDHSHPPLDVVSVGLGGSPDAVCLRLATTHPEVVGFRVVGADWTDDVAATDGVGTWTLRRSPAGPMEQTATVSVLTRYGTGRGWPLRWRG